MNGYGDLADRLIYDLTAERDRARAEVAAVRTYERQQQSVLGAQLVDAEERADAAERRIAAAVAYLDGIPSSTAPVDPGTVMPVDEPLLRKILQEEA